MCRVNNHLLLHFKIGIKKIFNNTFNKLKENNVNVILKYTMVR